MLDRNHNWDGSFNARDLGGFQALDGRMTRWGAVVRSERPDAFTSAGWSELRATGIRTIVDLRNGAEHEPEAEGRAEGLATVHVPLEEGLTDDVEFKQWESRGLLGTPLYYPAFLRRWPERCAAAIAAIGQASPGGVLICCGHGRDRTGLVVVLLLALVGVAPGDIVPDYELSGGRLRTFCAQLGHGDESTAINEVLAREGTTARVAVLAMLASLDIEGYLRLGGLGAGDLAAVRARLLEPQVRPAGASY